MITKKYVNRTDLKVAGFSNLYFSGNWEENTVHLTADLTYDIGKTKYLIPFDVECERMRTSARNIEKLCRLMLEKFIVFKNMKTADQKKYAIQNGKVLD